MTEPKPVYHYSQPRIVAHNGTTYDPPARLDDLPARWQPGAVGVASDDGGIIGGRVAVVVLAAIALALALLAWRLAR